MSDEQGARGYGAREHYDRVSAGWAFLLGDELHYGVFDSDREGLPGATRRLTDLMAEAARLEPGQRVLDVGCGSGAPACLLAAEHGVEVVGITTSEQGVVSARQRAEQAGVEERTEFLNRDGMDNGLPDESFDRVWVLESSHLMRARGRLISECARVLVPGGRLVLCDIVLRREVPFTEVRARRRQFALLREVFGDARMEPIANYEAYLADEGLQIADSRDLTTATRPTFERWRENAYAHRAEVIELIGEADLARFVESCAVLEELWDDGTLGYGLIAASKPHTSPL